MRGVVGRQAERLRAPRQGKPHTIMLAGACCRGSMRGAAQVQGPSQEAATGHRLEQLVKGVVTSSTAGTGGIGPDRAHPPASKRNYTDSPSCWRPAARAARA